MNGKNNSAKTNRFWFHSAIFGLTGGAVAMIFGLLETIVLWFGGQSLDDTRLGASSTILLVASFALFFIGGYCLDKAYEPFYRRSPKNVEDQKNANE